MPKIQPANLTLLSEDLSRSDESCPEGGYLAASVSCLSRCRIMSGSCSSSNCLASVFTSEYNPNGNFRVFRGRT